jgi:hypothetical protein
MARTIVKNQALKRLLTHLTLVETTRNISPITRIDNQRICTISRIVADIETLQLMKEHHLLRTTGTRDLIEHLLRREL